MLALVVYFRGFLNFKLISRDPSHGRNYGTPAKTFETNRPALTPSLSSAGGNKSRGSLLPIK